MAGINGGGNSVKINNQGVGESNEIDIRKLEVRKLEWYNDNTRVTVLSTGRKKQSKTFINSWDFYKVRKTRFVGNLCYTQSSKCFGRLRNGAGKWIRS